MKIIKNKYVLGIFLFSIAGFIFFNIYTSKCHGDECFAEEIPKQDEYQIYKEMIPGKLDKQAKNNEIFLLDVREDSEWNDGRIEGANHLALGEINDKNTLDFPKDKPIYIYCRSGRRASEAEIKLKALGFDNIRAIGGINQWQERGGILVK